MSGPEAKQCKPVRTDSHFLSATLSQCTYVVVEDLCRVIPAVSWAPFQYVPVVWLMCSPKSNSKLTVLHYQAQQRSVALSSNNLFQMGQSNTSFALKQAEKDAITPELALLIWYESPFTLGHNFYNSCY